MRSPWWGVVLAGVLCALPVRGAPPVAIGKDQPLPTLAPMLEGVVPAVVNIAVRGRVAFELNPLFQDPFFRRFFRFPGPRAEREVRSSGSGVIVDAENGYVLTNAHVIQAAETIAVTLLDGRRLEARVVGADPETDVALLQVPSEKLRELRLGNSDELAVGDFVVAIGNPFALGHTVTSGIVSALGRTGLGIEGYEDFIQTDASINPGNSGGALVNLRGELVGINTAILAPTGGNVGIGFAIPVNMARRVMAHLLEHGEVRRGQLGIVIQDLTPELAEAFGIDITDGALVSRIVSGSAAEEAGLRRGDVVVRIDGAPVRSAASLRSRLGVIAAGETVELEVIRDRKSRRIRATTRSPEEARGLGEAAHPRLTGAVLGPLDESSRAREGLEGVEVKRVEQGSPAWMLGLRPGDVITSVNRQPVRSVEDVERLASAGGRGLLLHVQRGATAMFLFVQ